VLKSSDQLRLLAAACFGVTVLASPAWATDDRFSTAVAARERGDYAVAIELFSQVATEHPNDADGLRLLGTTLAFAHHYREAITVLERAHDLSPRDEDIAIALSRALLWSGKLAAARSLAADASGIEPANPDVRDLSASISAAERDAPRAALDVTETLSRVSIGSSRATWSETAATLSVPLDALTKISAGVDIEDRATSTDTRLSLRADRNFGFGSAFIGVTQTPAATFRERWSILSGVVIPIKPFLLGSIEVRRAHYDLVDVTVIEPGLTIHSLQDRWSVTAHSVNLWGEGARHHLGWSLRGNYALSSAMQLFAGGATYSDTEAGMIRRVDSAFVGAAVPISARLRLQIVADHEVRRTSYTRDGIGLGLHWRFGP
jgi:YaiO family outer membrane protein